MNSHLPRGRYILVELFLFDEVTLFIRTKSDVPFSRNRRWIRKKSQYLAAWIFRQVLWCDLLMTSLILQSTIQPVVTVAINLRWVSDANIATITIPSWRSISMQTWSIVWEMLLERLRVRWITILRNSSNARMTKTFNRWLVRWFQPALFNHNKTIMNIGNWFYGIRNCRSCLI